MDRVIDLDAVAAMVRATAAQVHVRYFRQGVVGEEKAPGELVSRVDREAELLLVAGLADLTPGVPVIGEEAATSDPSLRDALRAEGPVWLVDPLDGTTQFLEGSPDHAVMLALVQAGRPVCAVVHQPQHGRTYVAEQGSGTWRNGGRLLRQPADARDLMNLRGAVLRRFLEPALRRTIEARESHFHDLTPRTTCAGVEYPRILEGEADFLFFWRTLPWDHAPGALLLSEAGGVTVRPDGRPYRADDDLAGLLAAADEVTAGAVLRGLGLAAR